MNEEKKIQEYTEDELDKLELQSYRSIEAHQAELQRWQQNLLVIRQERIRRNQDEVKE